MNPVRAGRILTGVALALFVASAAWFGSRWWWQRSGARAEATRLTGGDYSAAGIAPAQFDLARWPKPKAQSRGPGWKYELFTPPEIFYDADTKSFRVTLAEDEFPAAESRPTSFGLALQAVEPEPFPLQLIGFVGAEGNLLGTFENLHTSETLMLREGGRVPDLGLTVERITVIREPVAIPDSMTVRERRVRAVVRDDRTGETTQLDQGERRMTGRLRARVRFTDEAASPQTVAVGDVVLHGDARFTIEKIRLAPPEMIVNKETSATGAAERQTLAPTN